MRRKTPKTILHILTTRYIVFFALLFLVFAVFIYFFTDDSYRTRIYDPAYNGTINSVYTYMDQLNMTMNAYNLAYGSFMRRVLTDIENELQKHPNESTASLEEKLLNLSAIKESGIGDLGRLDFYIIDRKGIIVKTDYATDLRLNIPAVVPFYWKKLDLLKTGETLIDPIAYEERTGMPRIYGYRRMIDGSILEIGIGLEKNNDVFQKIIKDVNRIKNDVPYVKNIYLYNADFKPFGEASYPPPDGADVKRFNEINPKIPIVIDDINDHSKILYTDWLPQSTDIHSTIHMKIEMDFSTIQAFKFYIILFFILIIGMMGIGMLLIQIFNAKKLIGPFDLLSRNMMGFLKTGRYSNDPRIKSTGIIEFDELSRIYDRMAKKLNSNMQELKTLNTDLSKTVKLKEEKENQLRIIATRDELTGLYNRRACFDFLRIEKENSIQNGKNFTVCFIDIDNLKTVNDVMGHHEGDNLIKKTGDIIKESVRESDIASRLSGDEFLVIFADCRIDHAMTIWGRIMNRIEKFNEKEGGKFRISVSHGYSEFDPVRPVSVDELVKIADAEMYKEKRARKEKIF